MKQSTSPDLPASLSRLMDLGLNLQHINKALELKFGLSIVQWSLLNTLLEMPAVSPLVLSRSLKVTPGTLTQTLNRLSRKKYLFMCEDPRDARKKMISLTRQGRDIVQEVGLRYSHIFFEIQLIEREIKVVDNFLKNKVKGQLFERVECGLECGRLTGRSLTRV